MTVRELIAELERIPPEKREYVVWFYDDLNSAAVTPEPLPEILDDVRVVNFCANEFGE